MKTIIVIPTLNEKKNISLLISKILKVNNKFDLLFVDDNSKDGTRDEIIKNNKQNKKINKCQKQASVLFVDDNSKDGSVNEIKNYFI